MVTDKIKRVLRVVFVAVGSWILVQQAILYLSEFSPLITTIIGLTLVGIGSVGLK